MLPNMQFSQHCDQNDGVVQCVTEISVYSKLGFGQFGPFLDRNIDMIDSDFSQMCFFPELSAQDLKLNFQPKKCDPENF